MTLLQVDNLSVAYAGAEHNVVDRMSFSMQRGESLAIVGESGAGKSQTALALMNLLADNASVSGSIRFEGTELLGASSAVLNQFRARRIAMIFQDSLAALNPYHRIGNQLRRILLEHSIGPASETKTEVLTMLERVGLPDSQRQYHAYPHQLSGGMRQRVMIGAALLGQPELIIADEPTTALDVTVQAQILRLLRTLRAESNVALLLITHDLGVVAGNCERTIVMHKGKVVEDDSTPSVFARPASGQMQRMLDNASQIGRNDGSLTEDGVTDEIVFDVKDITVTYRERYRGGPKRLNAVYPTSFALRKGETIAIVGESGSGKSSLVRALTGLVTTTGGTVSLLGKTLPLPLGSRSQNNKRELQMVFQDPLASLNPTMTVAKIVAEPLHVHAGSNEVHAETVLASLRQVGLDEQFATRLPHELSGGQAQRVAIARALITTPKVLICDEAMAALDGTVRGEVLTLLQEEQERSGLTIIFISHDLAVVRQIAHRIAVMYMGRLCEIADNAALFTRPRHPYTKMLLNAVPVPDPAICAPVVPPIGEAGSLLRPPTGCPFHPRCEQAVALCSQTLPPLSAIGTGLAACHRTAELDLSYS